MYMKKRLALIITVAALAFSVTAAAANKTTYTFKGNNVITDGSPNDITDVPLTENITVTTSGDMNRKYAAITDLKHNSEAGTYPINKKFRATGSYIYLGCANANDNAIITLNMPEIPEGSKVTLTFAKPTVTNNGSTLRNTNDPYAYLKIADRYISINGDNFDTWRTESVVTGEDTDAIEFHADKWGAVAISKIEISDGDGKPLHSLNISSTQYANLTVNGIKFCADANGKITIPSYPEGEKITVVAEKDGYAAAEKSVTIAKGDASVSIPLECDLDAAYYESDFGNAAGVLSLDGEYKFGEGIEAKEVTRVFANVTFTDGGYLDIKTDGSAQARISYADGAIYLNNEQVTAKDNMEFELFYDKKNGVAFLKQNDKYTSMFGGGTELNKIESISGEGATVEYIGVSYPDTTKITIVGQDKLSSYMNDKYTVRYRAELEYFIPETEVTFTGSTDFATVDTEITSSRALPEMDNIGYLTIEPNASGTVMLVAEYNGAKAVKTVTISPNPKIAEWGTDDETDEATWNLHHSNGFWIYDTKDENGVSLWDSAFELRDFKSSDESVMKIDENGNMTAVGKGRATISANAYTGIDNPVSLDYVVDQFYIDGVSEAETSYVPDSFTENEHITGYKVSWWNGTDPIALTQIPAATVKEDGTVVTAHYYYDGKLRTVESIKVKAGDKVLPSNGSKKVYFCKDGSIELIEKADTTTEGFAVTTVPQGTYYEISPIYTYTDIGDVSEGVTLDGIFKNDWYDLTFKKGETKRGDIFVNGYMAGNNVDQSDADRKLSEGSTYTVKKFNIGDNKITVSMTDGSTLLDSVTVERADYETKPTIYIIGDSLVCNYYGDFEQEVGGGRTGWGQVIGNYLNANIVNLANSGQFAKGLYDTAFPSVVHNRPSICLIECGYNDRSYSTREEMINTVKAMVSECRAKGITPILITPNASAHDYKPSVSWSGYLRDVAVDTECDLIDLSQLSYDFLYSLYGDDADGNITKNYNLTEVGGDTLHSSYAAAQKWASIVAQELKNMWPNAGIYNIEYEYTFTDTLGNKITCKID